MYDPSDPSNFPVEISDPRIDVRLVIKPCCRGAQGPFIPGGDDGTPDHEELIGADVGDD